MRNSVFQSTSATATPPPPGGNALLQNIKTLFVELGRICLLVTGLDSNGQVLMVLV